jgi:hypothetical protein
MKKTLTLVFLAAAFLTAKAQKTEIFENDIMFKSPYAINDKDIATKEIVTYGKVAEVVNRQKNGKLFCYINLEQKHYDNPIYLMVFENSYKGNWEDLKTLEGKTIFASGKIELQKEHYDGVHEVKPSINIFSPNQIKIITDFK